MARIDVEESGLSRTFAPSARREFGLAWPVLVSAVVGTAVGLAGTLVYSLPFFLQPLQETFGWSPTEVATVATAHTLGLIIGSPIAGRICDRVGVSLTACLSSVAYASILILLSFFIRSLPILYGGYFMASFVGAGTTYVVYSRTVSAWFDKARGLALGLTMSGAGLMAAIIPLVLPTIIAKGGWQVGYLSLAALALLATPFCLLILNKYSRPAKAVDIVHAGLSIEEAMRTRQFWTIWVGVLILSVTIVGSHLFLISVLKEVGVGADSAARMMAIYGLGIVIGRICAGFLLDRFHGPHVAAANFLMPAIGMLALTQFGAAAAPLYLLFLGLAAGAEGDLVGYLAGRYFGMKSYSEIFGWLFTALAAGVASGPLIVGEARELAGAFQPLLYIGAANCIVAAFLFVTLGPYRDFGSDTVSEPGDCGPSADAAF